MSELPPHALGQPLDILAEACTIQMDWAPFSLRYAKHLLGHGEQLVYQGVSNLAPCLTLHAQTYHRHTDINLAQAWGRLASPDAAAGSDCEAEHDFVVTDTQAEDAIHPSAEANIRAGVAYYEHLWRVAMPQVIRHSMPVSAVLHASSHHLACTLQHSAPRCQCCAPIHRHCVQ